MQFGYGTILGKRVKILQDVPLSYWERCPIGGRGKKKKKRLRFYECFDENISVYFKGQNSD